MADYDVVIIGSGAGGLAAGVALARAGKSVLVLEQHYLPGGWCHSFTLNAPEDSPVAGTGFKFSPGVHYIGELQEGGRMRETYEGLGVANDLVWLELNPDGFDHINIGREERFDIPRGRELYRDRLKQRFPTQSQAIDHYIDGINGVHTELQSGIKVKNMRDAVTLPWKIPTVARHGLLSMDRFMNWCGMDDPLLRGIVSMQAGDHGMPMSHCPMAMHAAVQGHYFNGGYYPKGGGMAIPKAFIKALRRHGGEIKMRAAVSKILLENRRAIGVRLEDGTEIRADHIISNADPGITFEKLLEPHEVPKRVKLRLRRTRYSLSAISLFFAVDMDVKAAGLDSGNQWYTTTPNIDATYDLAANADLAGNLDLPGCFLTTTTLKDPGSRSDGLHTMESFCFVSNEAFSKWKNSAYGERPEDYKAFKQTLEKAMFKRLDELVPGLSEHVVFSDLGTPLTNKYYCAATEGNLYGIEKNVTQIGPFGYPIRTPIEGLYMCGASTQGHGVAGATFSGLDAAKAILECRKSDLLTAKQQQTRILPSDKPELWPAEMLKGRKRVA